MKKNVLVVSIGFKPNMGGLETHLEDLTKVLAKNNWYSIVLTYKPVTTNISAKLYEKNQKIEILRIPWLGKFFYRLVKNPVLEFLYLTPALMIVLPVLLSIKKDIHVIHSHGLIAGFPSVFWGKLFGKRVITTTHSIYNFPQKGLYRNFAAWIFGISDKILTLSNQSKIEIEKLGVDTDKVKQFTYWIDLKHFKKVNNAKKKLNLENKFVVLSAGRLVAEKGIPELLEAASKWNKKISLGIAGEGPLEKLIHEYVKKFENIWYLGNIEPDRMPLYYSAADLLIIPSVHEEGFGRIILESLACGTPVVGSNRGAIPEAMNESVGKIIDISPENIKSAVEDIFSDKKSLDRISRNCRDFAIDRYSEKNALTIINSYTK
ncbi:glycosyltransferase family 4 protein [Candidatus Amesbacteria bacterium]|nr:glycosyltransferase family 4 protein [Candidatus Amesbacteria bacterium]